MQDFDDSFPVESRETFEEDFYFRCGVAPHKVDTYRTPDTRRARGRTLFRIDVRKQFKGFQPHL